MAGSATMRFPTAPPRRPIKLMSVSSDSAPERKSTSGCAKSAAREFDNRIDDAQGWLVVAHEREQVDRWVGFACHRVVLSAGSDPIAEARAAKLERRQGLKRQAADAGREYARHLDEVESWRQFVAQELMPNRRRRVCRSTPSPSCSASADRRSTAGATWPLGWGLTPSKNDGTAPGKRFAWRRGGPVLLSDGAPTRLSIPGDGLVVRVARKLFADTDSLRHLRGEADQPFGERPIT
jgi:hypothetical protein